MLMRTVAIAACLLLLTSLAVFGENPSVPVIAKYRLSAPGKAKADLEGAFWRSSEGVVFISWNSAHQSARFDPDSSASNPAAGLSQVTTHRMPFPRSIAGNACYPIEFDARLGANGPRITGTVCHSPIFSVPLEIQFTDPVSGEARVVTVSEIVPGMEPPIVSSPVVSATPSAASTPSAVTLLAYPWSRAIDPRPGNVHN